MSYHVDRFFAAVSVLAGHGHIKQRLITAYEQHLDDINDDELPVAVRQAFADLRSLMQTVAPLNGESPVCASVRKMSVVEAGECGESIVSLYRDVVRSGDDNQVALPLAGDDAKPVPPFLVKSS